MNFSSSHRAGAGLPTPAFLFSSLLLAVALAASGSPANAIPKEEFPDPSEKPQVRTEEGPSLLEQVVLRATKLMRAGRMEPSPEAEAFALLVYSRSGDPLDKRLAGDLRCRRPLPLVGTDPPKKTLGELLDTAMHSGSEEDRLAFLDRIEPASDAATDSYRNNPKAALAFWRAGKMFGDETLVTRGKGIVESLAEAQSPRALAVDSALALAAGLMSHHPTQMVLIGDPEDSTLTAMREACHMVFEPSKILINLDPAKDRKRIEELGYPADMAPVLFVCVESVCSAPIQSAEKVPETVREIVKLSRSLAE